MPCNSADRRRADAAVTTTPAVEVGMLELLEACNADSAGLGREMLKQPFFTRAVLTDNPSAAPAVMLPLEECKLHRAVGAYLGLLVLLPHWCKLHTPTLRATIVRDDF